MSMITARQCKAARHLLGWTQENAATASGVGISTIGSFENTDKTKANDNKTKATPKAPRADLIDQIREAFEKAGIEFLDGEGVKRRCQNTRTYNGPNACHDFFDEMVKEAKVNDCEIIAFIRLQEILTKYSGEHCSNNLQRLTQLHEITNVKCILSDPRPPSFLMPSFEIKTVPKAALSPVSFFVYGNKMAQVYMDACLELSVLAVYEASMAQEYKNIFAFYWDAAPPLKFLDSPVKQRAEVSVFA